MLPGTFHAGRCDVAVRAAVAPLLAAPALGWSVAFGIVIHPADNDIIDGLDVAELASRHGARREVYNVHSYSIFRFYTETFRKLIFYKASMKFIEFR
jgi:hypothetical protein